MRQFLLVVTLMLVPAVALGLSVAGRNYPPTVTIERKTMKLVGVGKRNKWFTNVYAMGAYSESGKCDPKALVNVDEPKYMRLDFLRDVSAEKMSNTIGDAFDDHLPKNASATLKKQNQTFRGYFKYECKENTVLEFIYIPGTGTIMKQNGTKLGAPLIGKEFARVLWDIYFGEDTCCSGLRNQIFESCGLEM